MGLRELMSAIVMVGLVGVAGADKPAKSEPAKAAKKPASSTAAAEPAERPDSSDPAAAKPGAGTTESAAAEDAEAAEPVPPHVAGPKLVELGNDTVIDLPAGFVLFERAQAQDILQKQGSSAEEVAAIVIKPGSDWWIIIEYSGGGYIDDSDADDLDADDLLDSYRKGSVEQNKRRKELGKPELFVDSWSEPPRYERAQHHLVWGLVGHAIDGKFINFFTRILGRNGYLSLNLIDAPDQIEASKKEALVILGATRFKPGATYGDHVSSDHSSGVGLRGLVLGGAGVAVASKLGLLAKLLLIFKKFVIIVVAGVGGFFRWLFRRKRRAGEGGLVASDAAPEPTASPLSVEPATSVEPPPDAPRPPPDTAA